MNDAGKKHSFRRIISELYFQKRQGTVLSEKRLYSDKKHHEQV
jgi:hypothetical protein